MKIFISDGTPTGFFTAVFEAYSEPNSIITSFKDVQLSIGDEFVNVTPDEAKAERVMKGLSKYDKNALGDVLIVLKSCDSLKETTAFEYIKKIFEYKSPVKTRMNLTEVLEFNDIINKVVGELHKIKGFLRFMESRDGTLYAPYSPDNDITELLVAHFAARLKNEQFVIHDVKRKIAAMYNGKECIIGYSGEIEMFLSQYEQAFKTLWKKYYNSVNIKSRPHIKQMKGYMPVRYWKFLPEKNDLL